MTFSELHLKEHECIACSAIYSDSRGFHGPFCGYQCSDAAKAMERIVVAWIRHEDEITGQKDGRLGILVRDYGMEPIAKALERGDHLL